MVAYSLEAGNGWMSGKAWLGKAEGLRSLFVSLLFFFSFFSFFFLSLDHSIWTSFIPRISIFFHFFVCMYGRHIFFLKQRCVPALVIFPFPFKNN